MAVEGPIKPVGGLSVWLVDDAVVYYSGPFIESHVRRELVGFLSAGTPEPSAREKQLVEHLIAVKRHYVKGRPPVPAAPVVVPAMPATPAIPATPATGGSKK